MSDVKSASDLARMQLRAFLKNHRVTCGCSPIEIRAERGRLECASCGRAVLPMDEGAL